MSADRPVTSGADISDEVRRSPLFAAARAWCLARYEYGPVELYVSPEARERHIDHDAHRTAADPAFLAAFEAMVDALVACGQAVHAERHAGVNVDIRHPYMPPLITPAVPSTSAAPVTYTPAEVFYEPDEDPADVQAAYDRADKGVTRRPTIAGEEPADG